jgi:hypothetical protein
LSVDDFEGLLDHVAAEVIIHNTVKYNFRFTFHYHCRYRAAVKRGSPYISNFLSKCRAEGSPATIRVKTLREEFATQVVDLIF